jgi:hypothetical protein
MQREIESASVDKKNNKPERDHTSFGAKPYINPIQFSEIMHKCLIYSFKIF